MQKNIRAQELCKRRGGRPGFPVPNSSYDLCRHKATFEEEENALEHKNSVKVDVDVLGSPSLISTVSVDVKHLKQKKKTLQSSAAV